MDLERAVVRALMNDWHRLNYAHFRDALHPPQLALSDAGNRLGRWESSTRLIELARRLVLEQGWGAVVEVLKHEMAHQYVDEVLEEREQTPHGEAFRRVCANLGFDAAARGPVGSEPGVRDGVESDDDRLPRRIARLLALAESPYRHEAESAMREAQRLMLKYNVAVSTNGVPRSYSFRHLGAATGRMQPHQGVLGAILGQFFFVEVIWVSVHRVREGTVGRVLEVCGTEANVETASYVHDFLVQSAEHLWREHRRTRGIRSDRDRRSYLLGVMRGFFDKLEAQKIVTSERGLVWVGDSDLAAYLRRRYPRQRRMRPQLRARPEAYAHGKRAGHDLVLHKGVAHGRTEGRGLLTGRHQGAKG